MHQLSILNSSEIPQLPDIHITLNDQWKNLTVDYNPVNDTGKPYDSKTADKSYLINTIKYYSKYHGKEIDSFVESKYLELIHDDEEFILEILNAHPFEFI